MSRLLRGLAVLQATCLLAGCSSFGAPRGATSQGREINDLWRVFFVAALFVAAVVLGLIAWSLARYRKRGDELPPQFRAHLPLEVAYTAIPVAIVAVLFALTVRTETEVDRLAEDPAVTIDVEAFAWGWRFEYEGEGVTVAGASGSPPEMVVPVGETVRIVLTSNDVIHAFYVPEFLFKRDAIPGRVTEFDFDVLEEGVYPGRCAEFCGLDHARMTFAVRAVPLDEFEGWLEAERSRA